MRVANREEGRVAIELRLDEGNRLASAIIKHAEDMPSSALDLANLVRAAAYAAQNDFTQPPDPWEPGSSAPPSV